MYTDWLQSFVCELLTIHVVHGVHGLFEVLLIHGFKCHPKSSLKTMAMFLPLNAHNYLTVFSKRREHWTKWIQISVHLINTCKAIGLALAGHTTAFIKDN